MELAHQLAYLPDHETVPPIFQLMEEEDRILSGLIRHNA